MPGLAGYVIRRLLLFPAILFVVSIITFSLGRFAPSDYVEIQAPPSADQETIERIQDELGLNDPIYQQYLRWVGGILRGDLGESVIYRGTDIEDVLRPRLWVTLQLNIVVLILSWVIGVPLGLLAAFKRGTWMDPFTIGVFLIFASVPVIVSIPLLQWLFSVKLGWLPTGGWEEKEIAGIEWGIFSKTIILPVIILVLPGLAGLARYVRAQALEVLDQDYVRTAHAKGLRETVVISRHVLRNAMLPIATIMGFELAALISGSIFVETFLGIPGIGSYAFESIGSRDYDSIMAIVLLGSFVFMLANLAVDIAYAFIDPRIRLGQGIQQ